MDKKTKDSLKMNRIILRITFLKKWILVNYLRFQTKV